MKTNLIISFVLSFFLISTAYSQEIENISVKFTRILTKKGAKEFVKGNIYYQAPESTVLRLTKPIHQWMLLVDNSMIIYYPKEQKAFKYTSKNPFSLPFFQIFVNIGKDNLGLSEAGFTLVRNKIKEDTLITYWEPPQKAKKVLGNIIVGLEKDKLIFVEMENAKGKKLAKIIFGNHFQHGDIFYPLEIISIKYQKNSSTTESVIYDYPQFNIELPEEVVNFKIPDDVEVEEIEW